MKIKRISGALDILFEDGQVLNFTILDRECDRCMDGNCLGCEEVGKPWMEYYQTIKSGNGFEKIVYERDATKAVKDLTRMIRGYLQMKGEDRECLNSER